MKCVRVVYKLLVLVILSGPPAATCSGWMLLASCLLGSPATETVCTVGIWALKVLVGAINSLDVCACNRSEFRLKPGDEE